MPDVAVGLLLNVLAFALVGIGPAWAVLRERGALAAWLLAPAVGFVLTAVFGTGFTALNVPVSRWALPWLIGASLAGVAYCLARPFSLAATGRSCPAALALGGFLLTGLLLVAPLMVGGLCFSVFRGNGEDSFNYMAVAGYLDHEPISWADRVDRQALIERHQSYERVRQLLNTRWTSSALLAFSCRIAGVPLYRFEYAYSLLSFLLAYGPALLLALAAGLGRVPAAALALVMAAGFWGQFVLDIRAVSQVNSLPVLLLLALLVVWIEERVDPGTGWRLHVLLGLTAGAVIVLYPEIVPMAVLGLALYFISRVARREFRFHRVSGYALSLILAAAAAAPVSGMLVGFVAHQFSYASGGVNNWHQAYFGWLYANPLSGLWGLAPFAAEHRLGRSALLVASQWGVVLLGAAMTVMLLAAVFSLWGFRGRKVTPAGAVAAGLSLAALCQFAYLLIQGQLWAAGKGLSFGYPYLLLLVSAFAFTGLDGAGTWRQRLRRAAVACLVLWIASQCILALLRIPAARRGAEYAGYLEHHGEYRRHQWDLAPLVRALHGRSGATVWYLVSNQWMGDYLGLVLGWDVKLMSLQPARDVAVLGAPRPRLTGLPDFIITDQPGFTAGARARAGRLSLLSLSDRNRPVILEVLNPNGIEGEGSAPFLWLGGGRTVIRLISAASGCALLHGRFILGPSAPDPNRGTLVLSGSAVTGVQRVVIHPGVAGVQFPVAAGINEIAVRVAERPVAFAPGDPRPLMVRLERLRAQSLVPFATVPAACPVAAP